MEKGEIIQLSIVVLQKFVYIVKRDKIRTVRDINPKMKNGQSYLSSGMWRMFKLLIDNNLIKLLRVFLKTYNPGNEYYDFIKKKYNRPLIYALNHNPFMAKFLIKKFKINPTILNNYPLRWASEFGNLKIIRYLLRSQKVDVTDVGNYAIIIASYNGYAEIVKLLIKSGADPSVNDNTPVKHASRHNHIKTVQVLLADSRVDPTVDNNFIARISSINNNLEILKLVYTSRKMDLSFDDDILLRLASSNGSIDIIRFILDNIQVQEKNIRVSMNWALDHRNTQAWQLLESRLQKLRI